MATPSPPHSAYVNGAAGPLIDMRCKYSVLLSSGGRAWRIKYLHCQADTIVAFPIDYRTSTNAVAVVEATLKDYPSHYTQCPYFVSSVSGVTM
jgi:hypothetical protein